MRHLRTTATAVEKLKLAAKRLRNEAGTSLAAALEQVAKKAGYDNWKHVVDCQASTTSVAAAPGTRRRTRLFEIGDASFAWQSTDGSARLALAIKFSTLKIDGDGNTEVELNIDNDGMRAQSVVFTNPSTTTIYLGNYFWVPEHVKRKGLATAMLEALAQAHNLAVHGSPRTDMPVLVEGFFVNEGAKFAATICAETPGKGRPSRLLEAARLRAQSQLALLEPPQRLHEW